MSPTKGPGACRKRGTQEEPVKLPQIRKIVSTETTEAIRLGATALSSPKVTVLSEVKSRVVLCTKKRTARKAPTKMAT